MGVKHWIFQRLSNVIVIIFGIWLLALLADSEPVTYATLTGLLNETSTRLLLLVTLVFACLNSILAGWQIAGDYAAKIGVSDSLMTGFGAVVSIAYFIAGFALLF